MAQPWCYMIVTPDVELTAGIIAIQTRQVPTPNPPRLYLIKFGDGDPDVQGRYRTHNPSYTVNVNRTGRNAGEFQRRVFTSRNFEQSPRALEWYMVWERTPGPPGHMRPLLLSLIADWRDVNMANAAQVTAFVNRILTVIPDICRSPV